MSTDELRGPLDMIRAVRDSDLSAHARIVFVALVLRLDWDSEFTRGAKYDRLIKDTGLRREALARALAELREEGWIEPRRRFAKATVYTLTPISSDTRTNGEETGSAISSDTRTNAVRTSGPTSVPTSGPTLVPPSRPDVSASSSASVSAKEISDRTAGAVSHQLSAEQQHDERRNGRTAPPAGEPVDRIGAWAEANPGRLEAIHEQARAYVAEFGLATTSPRYAATLHGAIRLRIKATMDREEIPT